MVRLKAADGFGGNTYDDPIFQFQYGSIKRNAKSPDSYKTVPYFNSNMVRLKGFRCSVPSTCYQNFNSNMVRLKVNGSKFVSTETILYFNSNMVRLKVDGLFLLIVEAFAISIPIWFD